MPARNALTTQLLKQVVSHYLESPDFNGIRLDLLIKGREESGLKTVMELLGRELLSIVSDEWDNPYIKRMPPPSVDQQLKVLSRPSGVICVYPTVKHMKRAIPPSLYRNRPFARLLALGHPQLEPVFFELGVLRRYQSDARYSFEFWGLDGAIGLPERHYRSREMPSSDKVLVQTFGLGSKGKKLRLVAVFLRYLFPLTPRHQAYWNSHRVRGDCKVEANYYMRSVFGEWTKGISVYSALLEELSHINKMCSVIGLPQLFKRDFSDGPPKGFGLLMNTTFQEYLNFAHTLDKLISENLNPQFFEAQRISLRDKVTNEQKGTLRLLQEWLKTHIRIQGVDGATKILASLRRVRKERQPTAHTVIHDEFSPAYQIKKQELVRDVYVSISNIRTFFQTHPATRTYKFPEALDPENIVLY